MPLLRRFLFQVSVGSQQHRSRLAPLSGTRSMAQWDQDFAFAVVLPLKTRPLMLELHESKGGRRKGRPIARAYIPLADLFSNGKSDCKPHPHSSTGGPGSSCDPTQLHHGSTTACQTGYSIPVMSVHSG